MHASTSSSAVSRAVTTAPAARRGPLASHASGAARSQRASTSSALSLRHPRGRRRKDAAVHLARARNAGERAPKRTAGTSTTTIRTIHATRARAGPATAATTTAATTTTAARAPVVVPIAGRLRAAGAARRCLPGRHAAHPARDTVAVTHRSHRRAVRVLLGRTGDGGAAAGAEPRRAGGDGEPHGAARGAHRHVLPVGAGGASPREGTPRRARDGTSGCGAPGSSRWRRATPPRARGTSTSASGRTSDGGGIEARRIEVDVIGDDEIVAMSRGRPGCCRCSWAITAAPGWSSGSRCRGSTRRYARGTRWRWWSDRTRVISLGSRLCGGVLSANEHVGGRVPVPGQARHAGHLRKNRARQGGVGGSRSGRGGGVLDVNGYVTIL